MALATQSEGSGEFAPVRVWSCPLHHDPQTHVCDCDLCEVPYYTCESCASAEWVDKTDDEGNVVLRELSVWEVAFRRTYQEKGPMAAVGTMFDRDAKISWLEDEAMPNITS